MKRRRILPFLAIFLMALASTGVARADNTYLVYNQWGGTWSDVNKSGGDSDMCWAAAASNILYWAGYYTPTLNTANLIFNYFKADWTNLPGLPQYAWSWFLDGNLPPNWSGWSQVTAAGGNFWPQDNFMALFYPATSGNLIASVASFFNSSDGVALCIYTPSGGGHALTCWGYNYNNAGGVINYTDVWVTDSDDGVTALREYPISWNSTSGVWDLGGGYQGWYIGGIEALGRNPEDLPRWRGPYLSAIRQVEALGQNPGTPGPADLNVDTSLTNSPYNVTGNITYGNENVGIAASPNSGEIDQSAYTNTVNNNLSLGAVATSSGTYKLRGGSLSVSGNTLVGDAGSGTFYQDNSSGASYVTVGGTLTLGSQAGSSGSYNLTDTGTGHALSLVVTGDTVVGDAGSGTFTQGGGSASVHSTTNLTLGNQTTGSGTYNFSGGSLSVSGYEIVGNSGSGAFTQSGGTHTVAQILALGLNPGASGTYNLSGGSLYAVWGEAVGYEGYGAFTQSGGTNSVGELFVGENSPGSYSLGGGSLQVINYGEAIGDGGGSGSFTQSGGSHTVTGGLWVGSDVFVSGIAGTGSYKLSVGSLSVAGGEYIGDSSLSSGSFTQSGGSHTVTGGLYLGSDYMETGFPGTGSYNLIGGSLSADSEYIGNPGSGSFTQSGGTNTASGGIGLGFASGSSGTYNLSGSGSLSAPVQYLGYSGTGAFTQTGGTNTVTSGLYLGTNAGSRGAYTLGGGTGSPSLSAANQWVGVDGTGSFTQTGGTNTVNASLTLGKYSDSSGTYNLSGGSLSAKNQIIGYYGPGAFTQTGGSNTVSNAILLGDASGASGAYTLGGGTGSPSLSAANQYVGLDGTGSFTQMGGTNTVNTSLTLGLYSGSSGTYNLSGGSLMANTVNLNTGSTFNQTGGTFDFTTFNQNGGTGTFTNLLLGINAGSSSSCNLIGGSLSAANQWVGVDGTGSFTQKGGSNTVSASLTLGKYSDSRGTYSLSGGSLSVKNQIIGYYGPGAFTQTGGSNTVSNAILLGDAAGSSGAYTLGGGTGSPSLSAANQYVGLDGSGTFTQTGGSNTVSACLTLGLYSGSRGTYNLQGGSLQAANVNIKSGGTFAQTGGSLNATTSLTNAGTYTMAGGTLTGGGTLTNNASFSGYGTINANAGFENYGTLTFSGGITTFSGNLTNETAGSFNVQAQTNFYGNIYNWGYIKVTNSTLTLGSGYSIIEESGGTLNNDPATISATTLNIGATSALQGSGGSSFLLSGNLISHSTENITWNTVGADLVFTGGGGHQLYLTGADLGRTMGGYTNNFAWGTLDLTGQSLTLVAANNIPDALYVGTLLGALLSGGQVSNIYGNGLDIYYNPDLAANAYLGDGIYSLSGGGYLMPVLSDFGGALYVSGLGDPPAPSPMPGTFWLLLSGLAGLGLLGRGRMTKKS